MARKSKQPLPPSLEKKLSKTFFQILSDIRNPRQAQQFVDTFFTEDELSLFIKRLGIAMYLEKKKSYEFICTTMNVSTATIASVADMMKDGGYSEMLKLVQTDEWASKWTTAFTSLFKSNEAE